jgi:YidC/Oxa1 family membrane protein insertase
MKFKTTILLIIFSFSLLMIWERWINYGTEEIENGLNTELPINKSNSDMPESTTLSNNSNTEIPQITNLNKFVIKEKLKSGADSRQNRVELFNNDLKIKINLNGGKIDYSELLNQKVSSSNRNNTILLDKSLQRTYIAQTGLIGSPSNKKNYPNHTSLFEVDKSFNKKNEVRIISSSNNVKLTKTYKLNESGYDIEVKHEITNIGNTPLDIGIYLQLLRDDGDPVGGSSFYSTYTGPVFYSNEEKFQKVSFSDIRESKDDHIKIATNGWTGIIQHYYVTAWLIKNDLQREFYSRSLNNNIYSVGVIQTFSNLLAGETKIHNSTLYVGPQYQETLRSLSPGLDLVVDYGVLTLIAKPIFWLLDQLHGFIGNWGWAIVFLTIIIKLIFYPLTAASYRSMAKMKGVSPKIMQLREQHKDDKLKLNQSMMDLYKKEKINPLEGVYQYSFKYPFSYRCIGFYWLVWKLKMLLGFYGLMIFLHQILFIYFL